MGNININIRIDEDLKAEFTQFCDEVGMSMTTAFCVFARQAVRERRIPFQISADPYYNADSISKLEQIIEELREKNKISD